MIPEFKIEYQPDFRQKNGVGHMTSLLINLLKQFSMVLTANTNKKGRSTCEKLG
jgi:hypothetical protein